MKLIRLSIKDHLLLHDIDLFFNRDGRLDQNESYRLDLLVGVNGTGKSTLLRSLVEILLSLRGNATVDYPYKLEYELFNNGQSLRIIIDNSLASIREYEVTQAQVFTEDGTLIDNYFGELPVEYLPKSIVVYTTGLESVWERSIYSQNETNYAIDIAEKPLVKKDEQFAEEIPLILNNRTDHKTITTERNPVLLLRNSRLNAITLCGFLHYISETTSSPNHPLTSVLEATGIEKITGFSLRFSLFEKLSDKSFYQSLLEIEPAPTILQMASDRLVIVDLIKHPELAKALLEKFTNAFELFKVMDSQLDEDPTHTGNPTLKEVNLFLQRKGMDAKKRGPNDCIPGVLLLDWLSDGERSFLGRMAILSMLDVEDSLIILDEPEAHFNDYWKREIINITDQLLADKHNHIIITTHSSIMLSDITEPQVVLLSKNEFGWSEQVRIHSPLLAVDPSEIMVDYFQTKKSVGAFATRYLNAALERGNYKELEQLLSQVGPGYWRYRIQNKLEELNASSS